MDLGELGVLPSFLDDLLVICVSVGWVLIKPSLAGEKEEYQANYLEDSPGEGPVK